MTATTKSETVSKEELKNDINEAPVKPAVDAGKLAALKAKQEAKQQEEKMAAKIVATKERSLNFGCIGSGQAGSRLVEEFYKLGYNSIAINTAMVDLKYIAIPDANKLLLEYGLGGAAKDLEIGRAAAESHRGEILQMVNDKLANSQVNIFCTSLGGGSGSGSAETLCNILSETGKPLIVMAVLPMDTEDAQTKANALETLSKLAKLTQNKKINNLIVVDNAKIEAIFANVKQMDFYGTANKSIVNTIDVFNTFSSMPSKIKSIDQMEFGKLIIDGEGLTVYGELSVSNFLEETSLAEAIIDNLNGNLLAGGFDLKQSRFVGVIFAANKEVWDQIPSSSVTYGMSMINDACGNPKAIYRGIYTVDSLEPVVKVYSMFSGLLLPDARIDQLKKESAELQAKSKAKDENRGVGLQIDIGSNETVSAAQKVKEKIAAKSSAFGKLVSGSVTDRRK
jgi:cell division GTPase FtsZ